MKILIKKWSETSEDTIWSLFDKNPFPLFRNTPLADERMNRYSYNVSIKSSAQNKDNSYIVFIDEKPILCGQLYKIKFLSDYWKMNIGGIGHISFSQTDDERMIIASKSLIQTLASDAIKMKLDFLSLSVPGPCIAFIKTLEENGFRYAEGFINMSGPTNDFRSRFQVPGLKIRRINENDFSQIEEAYGLQPFPSRFVSDGGFDPQKALQLYVKRFKEVYEENLGEIFVAELNNKFAGALIAIIDKKLEEATGVKTNILSGMGIIIHPRAARRGVSLALIEKRQDYYKKNGVSYVSFGANFNNRPMILGLGKLGLKYASLDMSFHCWL